MTGKRLALMLFVALVTSAPVSALELVFHVRDLDAAPVANVEVGLLASGRSAFTGNDGRAVVQIDIEPGQPQAMQLLTQPPSDEPWVLLSPIDGAFAVPQAGTLVSVTVVRKGNRDLLRNRAAMGDVVRAVLDQVATPREEAPVLVPSGPRQGLSEEAARLGLTPDEVDRAIRAWAADADDPIERGLAELYDRNFPAAETAFEAALAAAEARIEAEVQQAADAARYLGRTRFEAGKRRRGTGLSCCRAIQARQPGAFVGSR